MGNLYLGCALVGFLTLLGVATPSQAKAGDLLLYMNEYATQKVVLAMHEKGLKFKERSINFLQGENYESWFLKINPLGELPVLKEANGDFIKGTTEIIDYLEDTYKPLVFPNVRSLVPPDEDDRTIMHGFQVALDAIFGKKLLYGTFYFPALVKNPKFPYWSFFRSFFKAHIEERANKLIEVANKYPQYAGPLLEKSGKRAMILEDAKNIASFNELLDQVDDVLGEINTRLSQLADDSWLVNKQFSLADVSLTYLLDRLDVIGLSHRFWGNGKNPKVEEYFKRVQQREAYKATVPSLKTHIWTVMKVVVGEMKATILAWQH